MLMEKQTWETTGEMNGTVRVIRLRSASHRPPGLFDVYYRHLTED